MKLIRIKQIKQLEPYKIICDWSNGEMRSIDFVKFLKDNNSIKERLLSIEQFEKVKYNPESQTIYWDNFFENEDPDLRILDFCPDVLYEASHLE